MARDFNFTISSSDIWGHNPKMDPLLDYLQQLFTSCGLSGVFLNKLSQTWRNGRVGKAWIRKRMDRFFIVDGLEYFIFRYMSRDENSNI